MKIIVVLLALCITACGKGPNILDRLHYTEEDFTVLCLDNVQYWARAAGSRSYMTAKIDPVTLKPMNCEKQ